MLYNIFHIEDYGNT